MPFYHMLGLDVGSSDQMTLNCAYFMRVSALQVDEAGNIIDSCFKTFGCGSAIASSSVATEWYAALCIPSRQVFQSSDR